MLKVTFWITVFFLITVIAIGSASYLEILPSLMDIGRSSAGPWLTIVWAVGLASLLINTLGMIYAMIGAKRWLWVVASFLLAPLTTLYYYWCIYRAQQATQADE